MARGVGILGAGTVLAAFLGLALQALIGFFFGIGRETDAYFMSLSIVAFLAKVFMFGHLKSIALPEYRRLGAHGGAGNRFLGGLSVRIGAGLLLASGAAFALAPWLVDVLAPGYAGGQRELTIQLLRIRIPAIFLLGVTTVSLIALEAVGRFGWVVAGRKVLPAATTVLLLVLAGERGGIVGLGWMGLAGAVVGGSALLVFARPGRERDTAPPPAAAAGRRKAERTVWKRWAGFGWSNAAVTVGEWVYRIAASTLGPGLFTAVVFGRMVHDLLQGAVNDSAATVALSRFSVPPAEAEGKPTGEPGLGALLDTLAAATVPVAAFVALMSGWIAALLFGRGQLLQDGMLGPVALAMALFMIGFVVQGRNQVAFQAAFARGRSEVVNRVQVIGHLFRAAVLVPAVWLWSFAGLVMAQVAMNIVVTIAFWALVPADFAGDGGRVRGGALRGLGRISAATAVPAVLFLLVMPLLPAPAETGELARLGVIAATGAAWTLMVFLAGRAFGVPLFLSLRIRRPGPHSE